MRTTGSNLERKSSIIIEKNGVNMKILYENTEELINQVWVTFPLAESDAVKQMTPAEIKSELKTS